jgi:predicted methyltransferase
VPILTFGALPGKYEEQAISDWGPSMRASKLLTPSAMAFCVVTVLQSAQPQHAQPGPQGAHREHRFDDPERYAKSFDDPARDEWQMPARVIETLALAPGQVVADIGAGTGYFSVRLAKAAARPKVYAVDIEKAWWTTSGSVRSRRA